jgi:bacterioferritin-associated ferredoxin
MTGARIVVCRCEDVTLDAVRRALVDGGRSFDEVKRVTRVGMGECQGRMCECIVTDLLCREAGIANEDIAPRSIRPPVRPLSVAALGTCELETPDHESSEHWFQGDLGTSVDTHRLR